MRSHYDWLDQHFVEFLRNAGVKNPEDAIGLIVADGDKCYGYQDKWEEAGIAFCHGVALYLLPRITPWSYTVRQTANEWVSSDTWVINKYEKCRDSLPAVISDGVAI